MKLCVPENCSWDTYTDNVVNILFNHSNTSSKWVTALFTKSNDLSELHTIFLVISYVYA